MFEETERYYSAKLKSVRLHFVGISKLASRADSDFMIDMPVDDAIDYLLRYKEAKKEGVVNS